MAKKGEGLFYAPSPPPQFKGEEATRQWVTLNLERIAQVMQEGRSLGLRLDVSKEAPAKPASGLVQYFAASVVGPTEGLYEYRATAWQKL